MPENGTCKPKSARRIRLKARLMVHAEPGEFDAIDRLHVNLQRRRGEGPLKHRPEKHGAHGLTRIDGWLRLHRSRGIDRRQSV